MRDVKFASTVVEVAGGCTDGPAGLFPSNQAQAESRTVFYSFFTSAAKALSGLGRGK